MSMPQRDEPGQRGSTQQGARPGESNEPGTQQGTMPGQSGYGQAPGSGIPGQPGSYQGQQGEQGSGYEGQQDQYQGQQQASHQHGGRPGSGSPVNDAQTRVTGRRIVQYLIDNLLVWLIPGLVSIPFDMSSKTSLHIIGGIIFAALFILISIWYWVVRPHSHHGQTFGMQLLGLRVISKDGGPANMTQLFIRWICLIFDAFPYNLLFTGLVGYIVILCSRHRQRIGDHLARTLVIDTGVLQSRQRDYAEASTPGSAQRFD